MKSRTDRPPILFGAIVLAALSLIWSAYAITDLMHSGKFGLSVAVAGDIGWITVLWAEYKGLTIAGRQWAAPAAGWLIAVGVASLLVIHGNEVGGRPQAIAGPFVVLVGKTVWAFALAAMKDPTAPTPEQQAEIHAVMRASSYEAQLHDAVLQRIERATDADIARIRAEARTTLARDDADFEITLERVHKRAEIERRTPLALPPGTPPQLAQAPAGPDFDEVAEQAIEVIGDPEQGSANTIAGTPNTVREQIANKAVISPNAARERDRTATNEPAPAGEPPSLADLVREQVRRTANNGDAARNVLAQRPDANKESVSAAVRRERRRSAMEGGYG